MSTERVPLSKEDGQSAISDQADAIDLEDLEENIEIRQEAGVNPLSISGRVYNTRTVVETGGSMISVSANNPISAARSQNQHLLSSPQ